MIARRALGGVVVLGAALGSWIFAGCGSSGSDESAEDAGEGDALVDGAADGAPMADAASGDAGDEAANDAGGDTDANDAGLSTACTGDAGDADAGCYAITCANAHVHSLADNRDRLVADLARRKCTNSCALWAALNEAERYIFLMDTAYLGASSSRLYPPSYNNLETAVDHAIALYSINGPLAGQGTDLSGRGGNDYNRIYLGFDALGTCVMRSFAAANPTHAMSFNQWVSSDDLAGPHAPFTQREMIFWYKALTDLQSNGPQFHHWAKDSDFDPNGLRQRLGVCGVTDTSLTELTIAFDFFHNSDPLGDYAGRGGFGWQIVDQHIDINADWAYTPTGCAASAPVNNDPYGGGTFAGMGPSLDGGACAQLPITDGGC